MKLFIETFQKTHPEYQETGLQQKTGSEDLISLVLKTVSESLSPIYIVISRAPKSETPVKETQVILWRQQSISTHSPCTLGVSWHQSQRLGTFCH